MQVLELAPVTQQFVFKYKYDIGRKTTIVPISVTMHGLRVDPNLDVSPFKNSTTILTRSGAGISFLAKAQELKKPTGEKKGGAPPSSTADGVDMSKLKHAKHIYS